MTVLSRLRSPDILVFEAPGALVLRRAEDGGPMGGDVKVRLVETGPPHHEAPLARGGGGRLHPLRLPGLRVEHADDPAEWPANARPFRVEVECPDRERLPIAATVSLPQPGARERDARWLGWAATDAGTLAPLLLRPGGPAAQRHLPLFPGVAARPTPLAEVRAHLRRRAADGSLSDAAHAVLAVRLAGATIGLGVADARGNVVAAFPSPPLATPTPAEAAAGNWAQVLDVEIRVWWSPLPPAGPDLPPLLETILAQTTGDPRPLLASLVDGGGGLPPLGPQSLVHGRPLVLRTRVSADDPGSSLVLQSP